MRRGSRYPSATFAEALEEAFALKVRFRRGFVAHVLDARGDIVQGWALTGDHHTLDDVVTLVLAEPAPPDGGVLVFSVTTDDYVLQRPPDDLVTFERLRARVEAAGRRLIDWLLVGDDNVRSMHFAREDAPAWPWHVDRA